MDPSSIGENGCLRKASEDFNPLACYEHLKRINFMDSEALGLGRPEQLILFSIPVPPVCIRPTVSMGDRGTREDDLTVAIGDIVEANTALLQQLAKGLPKQQLEAWEFLQEACVPWHISKKHLPSEARYINSEISGLPQIKGKNVRSICTRLKGHLEQFEEICVLHL